MSISEYQITDTLNLIENFNSVKEVLISALHNDGIISKEYDADLLKAEYIVVVKELGLFGKIYDKIFKSENKRRICVLKSGMKNLKKRDTDN